MSGKEPLSVAVRTHFLKGKPLVIREFAKAQGCGTAAIFKSMKQFGPIIKRESYGVWICTDLQALYKFQAPLYTSRQLRREQARPRVTAWDDLLTAWGLPLDPIDIRLPTHKHTMAIADDQTEEMFA